ncbi:MAG: LuxR C-terminal-related transcriptional regulator [Bdellovibrio sp.]|uniref:helix-turn-helix transcriptional regulator n=1 Tax=Bdellovibrio sp. TaxID=28201 RepID=UPI0039E3E43F|nr:LuxR C-terminal-related transcriptional regulator [Bdellovibrio sp.]
MGKNLGEFQKHIQSHFEKWGLTKTECEIGMFILRGLSLKQIAEKRGTSETTTRQQALSLYKKAAVDGRHQLSAFFIEHLLNS